MKLTFILPSMGCGGAQRVTGLLAAHWSALGWDVNILTLDAAPSFYPLPPNVRHHPLNLMADSPSPLHAVANNLRRVLYLRGALLTRRPDLVVSFLGDTNVKTLLACWRTGLRVVISERNNPARYAMGRAWRFLRRQTYPQAAALVVQTREIQDYFPKSLQHKIARIPNPLAPPPELPPPGADAPPVIMGMGRLHRQKGFDVLLRAFALLVEEFPAWRLRIHGQGGELLSLQALAGELGIAGRVGFPGVAPDSYAALGACPIFALPSRYEGFPNALMEAMASGRGVVAADCATGPSELIRHGENGLLVPVDDHQALAMELKRLMADVPLRLHLAAAAREVVKDYDIAAVAARWEEVFRKAGAILPGDQD